MYAVLHKKSPVGLPNRLTDEWGVLHSPLPAPQQALVFQQIAWETILQYPRDGISGTPLSISEVGASLKAKSSSKIEISWKITEDEDCSHFVIERALDDSEFEVISDGIFARNSNKYFFTDHSAPVGLLLYRIARVDCNANMKYIKTLKIDNSSSNLVSLSSNLVTENLNFKVNSDLSHCEIAIMKINGKIVFEKKIGHLFKGNVNQIAVNHLSNGFYYFVTKNRSGNFAALKFVNLN